MESVPIFIRAVGQAEEGLSTPDQSTEQVGGEKGRAHGDQIMSEYRSPNAGGRKARRPSRSILAGLVRADGAVQALQVVGVLEFAEAGLGRLQQGFEAFLLLLIQGQVQAVSHIVHV